MMKSVKLKNLKEGITSNNAEKRLASIDQLASLRSNKVLDMLLPLLNSEKSYIRDAVALVLRKIGNEKAMQPLIDAIENPRNKNSRGTLVYALEKLDCSKHLLFILELALYGNYEVQCHALNILKKQNFRVTKAEMKRAKELVRSYEHSDKKRKDYELLIEELSHYLTRIECACRPVVKR